MPKSSRRHSLPKKKAFPLLKKQPVTWVMVGPGAVFALFGILIFWHTVGIPPHWPAWGTPDMTTLAFSAMIFGVGVLLTLAGIPQDRMRSIGVPPAQAKWLGEHGVTLFAGFFATALGLFMMLMAAGWLYVDEETFEAPRWVAGLVSSTFFIAGLYILSTLMPKDNPVFRTFNNVMTYFTALAVITIFGIVASWIAFGPGERTFSGTLNGAPFVPSDLAGRIGFGFSAVILDAMALIGWYHVIKDWLKKRNTPNG